MSLDSRSQTKYQMYTPFFDEDPIRGVDHFQSLKIIERTQVFDSEAINHKFLNTNDILNVITCY